MSEIDEKLTELLKGKVVKNVQTGAFPDVFMVFEDGTTLHYDFTTSISESTNGDSKGLEICVSNLITKEELFEDEIEKTYRTSGRWS